MRGLRIAFIALCVTAGAPLSVMAADAPLAVKPGLWEITSEGQNSGAPAIPPEVLAQMAPELRAQIEARIKEAMAKQSQRRVDKRCVSQQDIDQGFDKIGKMSRGQCTETVISSSPTRREGRVQCTGAGNTSGTYRLQAPNPETIAGTWDMTMGDAGHPMTMKSNMQGKWLGADCGDLKPGN
jgi:hypothetical protein